VKVKIAQEAAFVNAIVKQLLTEKMKTCKQHRALQRNCQRYSVTIARNCTVYRK